LWTRSSAISPDENSRFIDIPDIFMTITLVITGQNIAFLLSHYGIVSFLIFTFPILPVIGGWWYYCVTILSPSHLNKGLSGSIRYRYWLNVYIFTLRLNDIAGTALFISRLRHVHAGICQLTLDDINEDIDVVVPTEPESDDSLVSMLGMILWITTDVNSWVIVFSYCVCCFEVG
jgi:hypothetical protein